MGLEVLIPIVMGALLQVAGRAGEGVLDAVQEKAKDAAGGVFSRLRSWWSGDAAASDDLERFQKEPDIYTPVIEARLLRKLTEEPDMQRELEALVQEIGPHVEVFQTIAASRGITGTRIKQLVQGRVRVEQKIENSEDIIGVDAKRVGPSG